MPVQNIECQIAQAQWGRYLAGETFSPEMLVQLEGHLSKCPECKADAARRRESQTHPQPEPAPLGTEPKAAPKPRRMALVDLARARSATTNPSLTKPLLYGGALAIVLIGMSYLARDPSALLGQKVIPTAKAAPVAPAPSPSVVSGESPLGPVGSPTSAAFVDPRKRTPTVLVPVPQQRVVASEAPEVAADPSSVPVAPVVPPAPAAADPRPNPAPPKASPKPTPVAKPAMSPRRTLRRAPKRPAPSGIRVYDSNGVPRRP